RPNLGARRGRESLSAGYCRKPGARMETDERHCPSSPRGAWPREHGARGGGGGWPRGQPTWLRVGQEVAGDGVGLVGGAEDDGKQTREIGRWSRVGSLHKFVDGVEFPGLEDHGGELGFLQYP